MKILKLTLIAVSMLAASSSFANDGHIQKVKIEKETFLQRDCLGAALAQITQVTNYAYQQMLLCGAAPECTQMYNNICNQGFQYVENSYYACLGGGNTLTAGSPLYKAEKSK